MFDFEKLELYEVADEVNTACMKVAFTVNDDYLGNQLKRSSMSVVLNLAEGTGRMTTADKKHFFVVARASVFETVALLKVLLNLNKIEKEEYQMLYDRYESVSKMLLGMIRSTQKQNRR